MVKHDIPGKVILLGTPGERLPESCAWLLMAHLYDSIVAEEGGAGKAILLEKGAYEEMDACLM